MGTLRVWLTIAVVALSRNATANLPVIVDRTGTVVLAGPEHAIPQQWHAAHFVHRVLSEIEQLGASPATYVVSTLDWPLQQYAESLIEQAIVRGDFQHAFGDLNRFEVRNGALAGLDYRTGEILVYVGSTVAPMTPPARYTRGLMSSRKVGGNLVRYLSPSLIWLGLKRANSRPLHCSWTFRLGYRPATPRTIMIGAHAAQSCYEMRLPSHSTCLR